MHVFVLCLSVVTEKIRQNDENLAAILEERQSILAEILNVDVNEMNEKAQVRT